MLLPRVLVCFGSDPLNWKEQIEVASHAEGIERISSRFPDAHIDVYGQDGMDWITTPTESDDEVMILAGFYVRASDIVRQDLGGKTNGAGVLMWCCRLEPVDAAEWETP